MTAHGGTQFVAIAAKSEATLAKARSEHPACRVFADYRDLLALDLDAVAVVLPSYLHFEISRAVLASGRHLLLEKPMAISVEHCDTLNALAEQQQLTLAVGHEMRHSSLWGKVKTMIDEGA